MVELQDLNQPDSVPAMLQTSDDQGAQGQQGQPPEPTAAAEAAVGPSDPQGAKAGRKRKATGPPEPVSEAASRQARAPAGKRKVQQASDVLIQRQVIVVVSLPISILQCMAVVHLAYAAYSAWCVFFC